MSLVSVHRIITSSAVGLVLMVAGCQPAKDRWQNDPEMVAPYLRICEGPFRDVGEVEGGSEVSETFTIINEGSQTVVLHKQVDASCGCTHAELSSDTIRPGQRADLEVALRIPKMYAFGQSVTAVIRVLQPSATPPFVVRIGYDAYMPWVVRPLSLSMIGRPGATCQKTINVVANRNAAIDIQKVETEGLPLQVDWSGFDEHNKAQIRVECGMPKKVGIHKGRVHVYVSGAQTVSQAVEVKCLVRKDAMVVPDRVLFRFSDTLAPRSQNVCIRSKFDCRVHNVFAPHPAVVFFYDSEQFDDEHVVEIEVDPREMSDEYQEIVGAVELVGVGREEECNMSIVVVRNAGDPR